MEIPKEVKIYCPKCDKHTIHKLKRFKKKGARSVSEGQRKHELKEKKGYGGKSEAIVLKVKQSTKHAFLAKCTVCGHTVYYVIQKRMKKVELVEK